MTSIAIIQRRSGGDAKLDEQKEQDHRDDRETGRWVSLSILRCALLQSTQNDCRFRTIQPRHVSGIKIGPALDMVIGWRLAQLECLARMHMEHEEYSLITD